MWSLEILGKACYTKYVITTSDITPDCYATIKEKLLDVPRGICEELVLDDCGIKSYVHPT